MSSKFLQGLTYDTITYTDILYKNDLFNICSIIAINVYVRITKIETFSNDIIDIINIS